MGELFNKLPYKKELQAWIETYGEYDDVTSYDAPASLEHLMRLWEDAKNEYLYKMFGSQFIIEQDFTFEKDRREIEDSMFEMVTNNKFYNEYLAWTRNFAGNDYSLRYCLAELIHYSHLATNEYKGETFSINIGGSRVTVQKGCKPSRVLGKIAKLADIDGYEDFRLAQSRIFNDRFSKGKLCLSIHPLDYMTMSDNEYGWESCMNWRNKGCYHLGTVEMMNSPMVVVAYIKGNKNMPFGRCEWNSKKWRNLFIVTKDIITGIKGYPYQNTDFDKACIKALQALAEKNLGYSYNDTVYERTFCDPEETAYFEDIDEEINFNFLTYCMYNDFGNDNTTHFIFGLNHPSTIECCYSGPAECMYCGSIVDGEDFEEPDTVICPSCAEHIYCDNCGERLYSEDTYYTLDDCIMCEECYLDHREYDPVDGEYHMRDNMEEITVIEDGAKLSLTSGTKEDIQEYITNSKTFFTYHPEKLPIKHYTYERTSRFIWWGLDKYHYTDTCTYVLKSDISEDLWSEIMYH